MVAPGRLLGLSCDATPADSDRTRPTVLASLCTFSAPGVVFFSCPLRIALRCVEPFLPKYVEFAISASSCSFAENDVAFRVAPVPFRFVLPGGARRCRSYRRLVGKSASVRRSVRRPRVVRNAITTTLAHLMRRRNARRRREACAARQVSRSAFVQPEHFRECRPLLADFAFRTCSNPLLCGAPLASATPRYVPDSTRPPWRMPPRNRLLFRRLPNPSSLRVDRRALPWIASSERRPRRKL